MTESTTTRPASASEGFRPVSKATRASKIMIIDDEPIVTKVLKKYLWEAGYENFVLTTDSTQAYDLIQAELPDLVLVDYMMPEVDGLDVLKHLRMDDRLRHIPVVMLTASREEDIKVKALEYGATDFLAKPVDASELVPRVRNLLVLKAHRDSLAEHSRDLEQEVRKRTLELESSRREVIHCLARAAEFRDDDTGKHVIRVGRYAGIVARQMGMDRDWVELLEQAAQLHDVGKIGIADDILRKPGKLTAREFDLMKQHCQFGLHIIQPADEEELQLIRAHPDIGARIMGDTSSPVLLMASKIALTHHEKWDGSGYPCGLAGKSIPIEGRITAIADVYDALSTKRPYKPAFPAEKCVKILEEGRATHFDPEVLDAFLARFNDIASVQIEMSDEI